MSFDVTVTVTVMVMVGSGGSDWLSPEARNYLVILFMLLFSPKAHGLYGKQAYCRRTSHYQAIRTKYISRALSHRSLLI